MLTYSKFDRCVQRFLAFSVLWQRLLRHAIQKPSEFRNDFRWIAGKWQGTKWLSLHDGAVGHGIKHVLKAEVLKLIRATPSFLSGYISNPSMVLMPTSLIYQNMA